MESALDWYQAKALLEWYVEMGVTDAVSDAPINRYELAPPPSKQPQIELPQKNTAPSTPPEPIRTDWVAEATRAAATASDLESLAQAMKAFDGAPVKKGARNFVFSDGNPAARILIVGDPPTAEDERAGKSFQGADGHMLDRMFEAIGLSRTSETSATGLYMINAIPWRAPGNRPPSGEEADQFRPFLMRHIDLVAPDVIVAMGNAACLAVLGRQGIRTIRGQWAEVNGRPVLPMFHPSHLLKTPVAKRQAWEDLLSLQAKLRALA